MQKNLKIEIDGFVFNVVFSEANGSPLPVVLLHGFTGRATDLSFLAEFLPGGFIIIAPDLPGHGNSEPLENIEDYVIEKIAERLRKLLRSLEFEKAVLLGYSMGGRIAYSFAARYPESVSALIIESATPGIENETERKERKRRDDELSEKILSEGVYSFVEYWLSLPIFDSLKNMDKRLYEQLRAEKNSNSAIGLANSLRVTGVGNMRPVWGELRRFEFPVMLINGALDKKYSEINKRVASLVPNVKHTEILNAGHNAHFENPHEFVTAVTDFISAVR